ncbi:hypothetical protein ACHAXS_011593 [Conticribra weissflogii]
MADEVPVQLDLEGGFVVGASASSSTNRVSVDGDEGRAPLVDDDEFFGGARQHDDYDDYYDREYDQFSGGRDDYYDSDEGDGEEDDREADDGYFDREGAQQHNDYSRSDSADEDVIEQPKNDLLSPTDCSSGAMAYSDVSNNSRTPKHLYQPPTLLQLTIRTIASKIEKYPPHAMAMLSEHQWETVVEARVAMRGKQQSSQASAASASANSPQPKQKQPQCRMHLLPAVSIKHLQAIEGHPLNAHLAKSKKIDELLWKDIVNYKYRIGGMTRPNCLELPLRVLEGQLEKLGEELTAVFGDVVGEEEYYKSLKTEREKEFEVLNGESENNALVKGSRKRNLSVDGPDGGHHALQVELFGQESENEDEPDHDDNFNNFPSYTTHLQNLTNERTRQLLRTLHSLMESTMDVKLLSSTGIGKTVAKVIKGCNKTLKKHNLSLDGNFDNNEIQETLIGLPLFWEAVDANALLSEIDLNDQLKQMQIHRSKKEKLIMTPLEILQQLLQDWKEMASENGVVVSSDNGTPAKKQKLANGKSSSKTNNNAPTNSTSVTTCGKHPKTSIHQHLIDLKLLHKSPDWRSLYVSLSKRAEIICKSQGEKMRSIRENLEKDRPKIGKVVLKKAVGRVRGMAAGAAGNTPSGPSRSGIVGGGLSGSGLPSNPVKRDERREAILNGSRGIRAQASKSPSSSSVFGRPSSSTGKMALLKSESRIQATWSKGSQGAVKKISHTSSSSCSAFGASVAFATGTSRPRGNGTRVVGKQKQVQVQLREGRQMRLPSESGSSLAKPKGAFSSLQQKLKKGEKKIGGGSRK